MNSLVEKLLVILPIGGLLILAGIFLGGEVWAKGKVVLGDILKFFGWAGASVRKLSVKAEYEGTINSIIQDYNQAFETPILPSCTLQWVTPENQTTLLNGTEAIICLSFDKKDHNLNFYNATINFVKTGLIAKTKNYLTKPASNAIDLLTTHIILRNNRREVLSTFRSKFSEFDKDTRGEFESLAPTNDRGLFLNLLLPEFHHYGELIDTLPPSSEFNTEAANFLQWFKDLATREFDARTNLKFNSKNFNVGVILVAKSETWDKFGPVAYTKWADFYSSEGYNSVYVLAKGSEGHERASQVTKILTQSKGFDSINRRTRIKCLSADGTPYTVTCFSLRPNRATISYLAWEKLKEYFVGKKPVPVIVESVQKEEIIVNAFGIKFEISNPNLSSLHIADARKIFNEEEELFLDIKELDADRMHIVLSNVQTISDPKTFIEEVVNADTIFPCKIERIQLDQQGFQIGLKASNAKLKSWVFIPRPNATFSRFQDLSVKYHLGSKINVSIQTYSSTSSNFIGRISPLVDPWDDIEKKLDEEQIINVMVKQINEFSIIGEIEEGLECILSRHELSWKAEECDTSRFNIDDRLAVRVILIEKEKRKIICSLKQVNKTPELEFFEKNIYSRLTARITRIIPAKGMVIEYPNNPSTGFIHWFDIGWAPVGQFEKKYSVGEEVEVVIADYNSAKNRIRFSIKETFRHDFNRWIKLKKVGDFVPGTVIEYFENCVHVQISEGGYTVQGFVLKKNISNLAFVEQEDLPLFMPIGHVFNFGIDEINKQKQTISLTRKSHLKNSNDLMYGRVYIARYVKENRDHGIVYANDFEGKISPAPINTEIGDDINVLAESLASKEFYKAD